MLQRVAIVIRIRRHTTLVETVLDVYTRPQFASRSHTECVPFLMAISVGEFKRTLAYKVSVMFALMQSSYSDR